MLTLPLCSRRAPSITSPNGTHLVIDAGHISIESKLADKKAVQEINAKRKQQYSEADYRRLESMMYDTLSVRLQDAQVGLPPPDLHVQSDRLIV